MIHAIIDFLLMKMGICLTKSRCNVLSLITLKVNRGSEEYKILANCGYFPFDIKEQKYVYRIYSHDIDWVLNYLQERNFRFNICVGKK